ncbi:MAG: hypothetical protein HN576_00155 [Bacteriovoracaceae bacterium]|jgi:hypothetical protein|nr:hypothetical protein [Bacteriovoracaceae bacterium]
MNEQGTKFLYSKENKEFYLDSFNKKSCPQSKMIFLLIDQDESEKKVEKFTNHVTDCEYCLDKWDRLREARAEVDTLIPVPEITREIQLDLEHQLSQLFKEVDYRAVRYTPSLWERFKSLMMVKVL